ncbi:MMPL family transporter [Paenibacillus sp. N1-5-1-14]|uniref:MMPL family transporter n=1 Tax=Paenibacillus radicibacter TaxID=2972488 RepID=UPI00215941B4|nr:MMPL family transporter [Paenibacillus radicibacter]MCR8645169.1 MMPL family transporter [Paenibacillus radicibacter]
MRNPFKRLAAYTSSSKGAKVVIAVWLIGIILLSTLAPGSKLYAQSSKEGSIHEDTPAAVAQQIASEQFPSKDGLTALLVFHREGGLTTDDRQGILDMSKWLASDQKPADVASALPYHSMPPQVQESMFSQDKTTLLLNIALTKDATSDQVYNALQAIRDHVKDAKLDGVQFEITGPAGISADTKTLFKNADFVLMIATIVLILVILVVIYRSPLLAIIPLLLAGVVYQVVDRILGFAAKNNWFVVDSSASSIMMVMLFAVLTDYCLFIISRYKEELRKQNSKNDAMKTTMTHLAEPLVFSGGTVLVAMLTLFVTIFKPYNHFAPVFSVAIVVILLAGLTLIPSIFTLLGRKAYWPFVPKVTNETGITNPKGFWSKVGKGVTKRPVVSVVILLVLLIGSALNVTTMNFSFNLMKSFPDNISSRQGFDILEQRYPKGELAPVTVILKSNKDIQVDSTFVKNMNTLIEDMKKQGGIASISPDLSALTADPSATLPKNFLSDQKQAVKLRLTLQDNPYDQSALDLVSNLRTQAGTMLTSSGLGAANYELHFAGQTAEQLDVKAMNTRDTILLFSLVTVFITIMLVLQTRSILMPIYMIATILLSFGATLGIGWMIFHNILGYDSISYRLPVYTFVFMVALGVDYNIMLVSRIKEEARLYSWREAVERGVGFTGGVISSAGIILAATFCVLITQPLQELFLFGMTMALGILIDTFLVRGILLPGIMTMMNKRKSNPQANQQNKQSRSEQL